MDSQIAEDDGYAPLVIAPKTGDERLHIGKQPLDKTLLDFWRWSASDLVSNAARGIFAEYIVANALGLASGIRVEWDAYDLVMPSGLKIEVKSAAYLQTWYHRKLSTIRFGIQPTRGWDSVTNELSLELKRQADVYVFCLLKHQDKASVDPLNLDQWEFYILGASVLDATFPTQKSIGLSALLRLNPCIAKYEAISSCVEKAQLVTSYAEFGEEDRLLVEEGIGEYARGLRTEDAT
ncbi:MAG TPA: hypothetical protein VEX13_06775 [Chloroflexia bacterium]|nr:hypothetical protein [Chloroflexia bacterium]